MSFSRNRRARDDSSVLDAIWRAVGGEPRTEERGVGDPFAYGNLRGEGLAVPIRKLPDGAPSWEDPVADVLRAIANLSDPADTAMSGRSKRDNRDTLEQMRQADRDAWSTIEHRLADRDRQLRELDG